MSTDHQTTSTTPNIHDHESKSSDLNSTPSQLSPQKQQPQQQQSHTDEKQTDISKQTGETDSNQIQPDSEPQKQKEEEEEEETEEQIIEKEKEKEKKEGEQQQEQQQEEESGVFSGWGFTSVNKVAPNMNSISSLLSSTGDSVGNLLNAPTSFFSSDNNENNNDNATNNNASNSDAPDAVPHNGDLVFNENSENNNNNNNNNYNNNLNENKNSPNGNNIEGEDLGVAASNLANVATAELEQASKAAQETIGKAAQELGRGWGTLNSFLDDMLAPEHGNNNGDVGSRGTSSKENGGDVAVELLGPSAAGKDINVMFKELFPHLGSSEDEEVVDHYKCSLIQKYRCYLNNSTPEKAFPLRGRLFVTMSNIAMYMTEDGGVFGGNSFGINIPFQEVIKIQKGSKSMLRVVTRSQTSFIFAEFESDTHYQGALSLLEQLGAAAATGVPPPMPTPTPAATTTQTPPHSASSSPAKTEESASADNEAAKSEEKQS